MSEVGGTMAALQRRRRALEVELQVIDKLIALHAKHMDEEARKIYLDRQYFSTPVVRLVQDALAYVDRMPSPQFWRSP